MKKILKFVLIFQGFYYALTGLWAIVSLESFSRITRHFGDPFEMHSIAAISLVIGLFFLWSSQEEELLRPAGCLALGFVLAVMIPELIYLPKIGNPTLFWFDFVEEAIIGIMLAIMSEKKTLEEKLSDFERKGNHWLKLMRNWILEANQAGNLIKQENLVGQKDFLVSIGSNRRVAAGMLLAEFKTPWNFLAEIPVQARAKGAGEVNLSSNSELWCINELCTNLF